MEEFSPVAKTFLEYGLLGALLLVSLYTNYKLIVYFFTDFIKVKERDAQDRRAILDALNRLSNG